MMPTCKLCGVVFEDITTDKNAQVSWAGKYGFCCPAHYVEYMRKNKLWGTEK